MIFKYNYTLIYGISEALPIFFIPIMWLLTTFNNQNKSALIDLTSRQTYGYM